MAKSGLWPTPNKRDWKDTGPSQGNRKSPNLGTAVFLWPTPTATMADRGGRGDLLQVVRGNQSPTGHFAMENPEPEPKGKLNPTWVAWLMGFPSNWLDLDG